MAGYIGIKMGYILLGYMLGCISIICVLKWKPIYSNSVYTGGIFGIMENEMETTIVYWGYMGIMEKKMETSILTV